MSKLIATITKNSLDEVRVSLREYKGHTYVDVRVFTELENAKDKAPKKKGITVRPDPVPELREALEQAEAEARAAGLTKGVEVYVEGKLSLNTWTGTNGAQRTGLSGAAWEAVPLASIGRRQQKGILCS